MCWCSARPPQGRALACQAALRGTRLAGLPPAAYGGHRDVNEAWAAGVLTVDAWPAAVGEGPEGWGLSEDLRDAWKERISIMPCPGALNLDTHGRI